MTTDDLRKLATAAQDHRKEQGWVRMADLNPATYSDQEARFVEACSPDRVLELLDATCGACKYAHGLAPGRIVCQQVIDDGHISSSSPVELSTSMTCPSHAARQEE